MPLSAGTRLGTYEIAHLIGQGGMGEVYRARDTKLGRDVALKVLPDAVAGDPGRIARFEREAQALAALNHPHIATLYGLEHVEGRHVLVMELVEGVGLDAWIAAAPTAGASTPRLDDALSLAIHIAEALEAAHERGIVHRDLKPANVKLTGDPPAAKVLDFGLAKAMETAGANRQSAVGVLANSPTITSPAHATQAGIILGTAAYMSPEQAQGLPTDHRTDIFAFGCVLFEMLTGRQAFDGDSAMEILAAVIKTEPDWSRLPAGLPPRLVELLQRCLAKRRRERYQAIGDVRADLEVIRRAPVALATSAPSRPSRLPWAVAAAMTALAAGAIAWPRLTTAPAASAPVTRFEISMPDDHELFRGGGGEIALTPDGRSVIYVGISEKGRGLYRRAFDQLAAVPIPGTEGAVSHPQVSPDGATLAFFRRSDLLRVGLAGGTPAVVAANGNRGIAWLDSNTLVFTEREGRLSRVSAQGNTPEALPVAGDQAATRIYPKTLPTALPGESVLAYTVWSGALDTARVAVRSLATGEERILFDGTNPRLTASGHLVFAKGSALWAVVFDAAGLQARGEPVRVVEDVQINSGGLGLFAISADGTLAYVPGNIGIQRSLVWVDRAGRETPVGAPSREYLAPRVSPDGSRIAVAVRDQSRAEDIWVWDISRSVLSRLTSNAARDFGPVWTRDGREVLFGSARTEGAVLRQSADGARPAEVVLADPGVRNPESLASRDVLIVQEWSPGVSRLASISIATGRRELLLENRDVLRSASVSPDGEWLAYSSGESGQNEVYVRPFPRVNDQRLQISTSGGIEPLWSPRGDELFYRTLEGQLVSVPVQPGRTFVTGEARPLIEARYPVGSIVDGRLYDVAPDASRFLMLKEGGGRIVVVQNWYQELERLVPSQR